MKQHSVRSIPIEWKFERLLVQCQRLLTVAITTGMSGVVASKLARIIISSDMFDSIFKSLLYAHDIVVLRLNYQWISPFLLFSKLEGES